MKNCMLYQCVLLKGSMYTLCLSDVGEFGTPYAVSGGGLPVGRNRSSESGWMGVRVLNNLSQSPADGEKETCYS